MALIMKQPSLYFSKQNYDLNFTFVIVGNFTRILHNFISSNKTAKIMILQSRKTSVEYVKQPYILTNLFV